MKNRKQYVPEAKTILKEIQNDFLQWLAHRKFAPTLRALKQTLLNGQLSKQEEAQEFSQVVYKLTGKVANYLKENPSKADQTLELIQQVYQLDAE